MNWTKVSRKSDDNGLTITYWLAGTGLSIESRKRHIPHANGVGTWDHTSYVVLMDGQELAEKATLKEAKEYAGEVLGCLNDK